MIREDFKPIQTGGTTSSTNVDLKLQIDPAFISLGENGNALDGQYALNFQAHYARLKAEYSNKLVSGANVKAETKGQGLNMPPETQKSQPKLQTQSQSR